MAVTPDSSSKKRVTTFFMLSSFVKQVLRTGAVGCRCDNLITPRLAAVLKHPFNFMQHFR
jgi:hypothetical protein